MRDTKQPVPISPEKKESNRAKLLELEKSGQFVFHGSLTELTELEPRQATGTNKETGKTEKDGPPAVFATQFADIAIFRALVNAQGVSGGSTSRFGIDDGQLQFATTQNLIDAARGKRGLVYVLKKDDFDSFSDMECRAHKIVTPVQVLEVSLDDLPNNIEILESEEDAHLWVQPQPPWEDFAAENINEQNERKVATPEQEAEMNQRLLELGQTMAGADFPWHIDGALNISLLNGKYIGYHKDVDLSVEAEDLEKLEAQLLKNGYGLFLSRTDRETGERTLRRVGHKVFKDSEQEHMLIAAIDERGRVRQDRKLNFVDVHIVERNEEGRALGQSEVPVPDAWTRAYPIDFAGTTINTSHPAKVLYFKLHQTRNYDSTDIDRLVETGKITVEDIDEVTQVFESEFVANIAKGRKVFETVSLKITPDMTPEQFADAFAEREEFNRGPEMRAALVKMGEEVLASGDVSADNMVKIAIKLFGVEEKNESIRNRLRALRSNVMRQSELASVRGRLNGED